MSDTAHQANVDHGFWEAAPSLVRRLDRDPNLFHVVAGEFRGAGPAAFFRVLELDHFPPGSRSNDNFNLLGVRFEGMRLWVASIPLRCRPLAELVAAEIGWRLADGVPHAVYYGQVNRFMMNSERVFTLEPRKDSIVYAGEAAREQADQALVERIHRAERTHYAKFDELGDCWYRGRAWKRIAAKSDAPPHAVDVIEMGQYRAKPSHWFTDQPRDPGWRPYPK